MPPLLVRVLNTVRIVHNSGARFLHAPLWFYLEKDPSVGKIQTKTTWLFASSKRNSPTCMANLSYLANKQTLSRMRFSTIRPWYLHHCQVTLPCANRRTKQLFSWGLKRPSNNILPSLVIQQFATENGSFTSNMYTVYKIMMQWCSIGT